MSAKLTTLAMFAGVVFACVDRGVCDEPKILPAPVPVAARPSARNVDSRESSDKASVFQLTVQIIEDTSGSFEEFRALRNGRLMIADSDPTLAAISILKKHNLCTTLSSPQIMCAGGNPATLQVGNELPDGRFQGIRLEVFVRELADSTIVLEVRPRLTHRERTLEIDSAVAMREGKTMVLKLRPSQFADATDPAETDEPPVYLAVTPTVVRK